MKTSLGVTETDHPCSPVLCACGRYIHPNTTFEEEEMTSEMIDNDNN
jgi:hypothetical protein